MDERKGPTWHCIVGRNFGSFVTHGTLKAETCIFAFLLQDSPGQYQLSNQFCRLMMWYDTYRDQALHILLPRPLRYPALQNAVTLTRRIHGIDGIWQMRVAVVLWRRKRRHMHDRGGRVGVHFCGFIFKIWIIYYWMTFLQTEMKDSFRRWAKRNKAIRPCALLYDPKVLCPCATNQSYAIGLLGRCNWGLD